MESSHGPWCPKPYKGECLQFSTDGTRLGTDIAHTMGTTSEREIIEMGIVETHQHAIDSLTGMDAEQAEWESEDGGAWR